MACAESFPDFAVPRRQKADSGFSASISTNDDCSSSICSAISDPDSNYDYIEIENSESYQKISTLGAPNPLHPNEPTEKELEFHLSSSSTSQGWCTKCYKMHTWNTAEAVSKYKECIVPLNVTDLGPDLKVSKEYRAALWKKAGILTNFEDTRNIALGRRSGTEFYSFEVFDKMMANDWGISGNDLILKPTKNRYYEIKETDVEYETVYEIWRKTVFEEALLERLKGDIVFLVVNEIEAEIEKNNRDGNAYNATKREYLEGVGVADKFLEQPIKNNEVLNRIIKSKKELSQSDPAEFAKLILINRMQNWFQKQDGLHRAVCNHISSLTNGTVVSKNVCSGYYTLCFGGN